VSEKDICVIHFQNEQTTEERKTGETQRMKEKKKTDRKLYSGALL
jgi:hypothetical protein